MTIATISDALRTRLGEAVAGRDPTAIRLAALLFRDCPVEALERAARSPATIERLASARHPRTPEASLPLLVREGPEADRLFWLGVVVHVTSGFENGAARGWKHLVDVASVLAELARAGALVDTPTHALARDLADASSIDTGAARLGELSQHPLPLVTALLLARGDLPEAAEVGMLLGEPHPIIAEKLALRTRSPLVLAALGRKLVAKVDRHEQAEWRSVEEEIVASPHTPIEVLEAIVARDGFERWWALAGNPALTPALQAQLVARGRARRGPLRPDGTHGPLVFDFELEALAGNASATEETLAAIAESPAARVRAGVAAHARAPDALVATLARDPDPTVRAAVARRPDLAPELARTLADDPRPEVVHAVAGNPRLPEDRRLALEAIAETDPAMRDALAKSPTTSPALLARWLDTVVTSDATARRGLYGLRVALASNPTTPPAHLSEIARTASEWSLAAPAARNPSCPLEALEAIAAGDTPSMRTCLFENPACPTPVLERALRGLMGDLFEATLVRASRNVLWLRAARSAAAAGAS